MTRVARLVALAAVLAAGLAPAYQAHAAQSSSSAITYHDTWRKLWEDHVTWTRVVILGVVNGLPGTGDYTTRLLKNYEDMEDALAPYFSEDDVEELGDLIKDHLVIAKQILDTVKAGGDPTALVVQWRQNGTDIATKMDEMNPTYWPFDMGNQMWQDHLTETLNEATAEFASNFTAAIDAYDRIVVMALDMADFFSNGVIRSKTQFKHEACIP